MNEEDLTRCHGSDPTNIVDHNPQYGFGSFTFFLYRCAGNNRRRPVGGRARSTGLSPPESSETSTTVDADVSLELIESQGHLLNLLCD